MSAIPTQTDATSSSMISRFSPRDRIIDNAERFLLLILYAFLASRLIQDYQVSGKLPNLLLLLSEALVVLFTLVRRRASEISQHPGEWILAVGATALPMLVIPKSSRSLIPQEIATFVLVMGVLVQVHAKFSLGRSFGCVPANRGIKLTGPYRFLRHPMYAGYLLSHVGFFLVNPSLWNLAVYFFSDGMQVPRLLAEERLLNLDPEYCEYKTRVRYRLFPGLF